MLSDECETELRGALARAAASFQHPEQARQRVLQRSYHPRRVNRPLVAGITAAAASAALGLGLYGITGSPETAKRPQTAAYVISRAVHSMGNLVLRGQAHDPHSGSVFKIWAYRDRTTWEQYFRGHLSVINYRRSTPGKDTWVSVAYDSRNWYRKNDPAPPSSGCKRGQPPQFFYGVAEAMIPAHFPQYVRTTLACGAYTITGHARIDGVKTIKLNYAGTFVESIPPSGPDKRVRYHYPLYVDASTYLPVRIADFGPYAVTGFVPDEDFQWLPATRASQAPLNVHIPSGFHRIKM
jgi:hypothetical protein